MLKSGSAAAQADEWAIQMETTTPQTSRRGYVIALIVFLLGMIGSAALVGLFAYGLFTLGTNMERMVAPGSEQFEFSDTGTHTIFYEYESSFDGTTYSTGSTIPALDISVTRLDDGADIEVRSSSMDTSYDLVNQSGQSIRSFSVDQEGTYEITAEYSGDADGPDIVLAISENITRTILTTVGVFFGGGLVFCIMTLIAIAIAGFTFYRRYQAERQPRS